MFLVLICCRFIF